MIQIKNMEMPKRCAECKFCVNQKTNDYGTYGKCLLQDKRIDCLVWSRDTNCPLAESTDNAPTVDVLDKIRAEIAEYGSICVAYAITDKTKTDKGIEKLVSDVLKQAKEQVLEVIDKYREERND